MSRIKESHIIRVSAILIIDNQLLIIEQKVGNRRWYLPGGKLERDETLEACIIREMREETGAEVEVEGMVCIADTEFTAPSALHILFKVKLRGGEIGVQENSPDSVPIEDVKFVPLELLPEYGFSESFTQACMRGLNDVPPYVGVDTFFDLSF